ncbi:hypothetical protein ACE1CI_35555 [Aerosakkonemataceae cyanobacterium BLCC-F50]|uniref:SPOR domain-containing protein n=1 Tax=Floridaenema flaviceps BLCC-F50 TaxID=3153642 RepID=A0ABV4Y3F8_9CYAN
MTTNRRHELRGIGELQFWSLGKLMSNFSALLSLLPLLMGGFFTVVTEGKAEARHTTRSSEECCVVTQTFTQRYVENFKVDLISQADANSIELAQFPDRFNPRLYRVYVPAYSDELLVFVQQEVTRSAFPLLISRGRRVIVVTQSDLRGARRAVVALQEKGLPVEMDVIRSNQPLRDESGNVVPDNRYLVYVRIRRGDDRIALLDQVQSLEPDATVGQIGRRNVILVRRFDNLTEAQSLVNELRSNGLRGGIYESPVRQLEPRITRNQNRFAGVELESDISNNVDRVNRVQNNVDRITPVQTRPVAVTSAPQTSYRLVIPIRPDELAAIEALARQMATDRGTENQVIIEANANKSQLIVGPFNNLQVAQQWVASLQDYGVGSVIINNAN